LVHLKETVLFGFLGVNNEQGNILEGKLNLVDLAGSERLSRSGATGSRMKETQAINKSLSCLTDVFTAIGNKSSHVSMQYILFFYQENINYFIDIFRFHSAIQN